LTTIPDGFNPTVGGSLDLRGLTKYIGSSVDNNFFWNNNSKRYAIIDGIFCEIISEKSVDGCRIFSAKKIAIEDTFYIVNKGKFYSHGEDLKKAFTDLDFKVRAEQIKKEPITKDTIITMQYYRIITGACEMGCKSWMQENGINVDEIKASELLPILKKSNAYGYDQFKKLVTF